MSRKKTIPSAMAGAGHPTNRRWALGQIALATSLMSGRFSTRTMGSQAPVGQTRDATNAFLNLLTDAQRASAQIDFKDHKRIEWHFIPMETRKGLALREMNDPQMIAAVQILKHVLSESGYRRSLDIMGYESILLELEGPTQAKRRDYKKFYFAIYGNPSPDGSWGLSVEGHHLSLNFTLRGDSIVDSTPQFFGVNPADLKRDFEIPDVSKPGTMVTFQKGTRLLKREEDAGFELLHSLDESQRDKAIYSKECPDDIQWPGEPQPKTAEPVGIRASQLKEHQLVKLQSVIDAFLANMSADVVHMRRQEIANAGRDRIHFGWAGGMQPGEPHFFRLLGPTFIAELCNFQTDPERNVANHIHSIWRDMTGDFDLPISAS